MDIDGDLFEKETSTVELIPRGVEDMLALFDTSEDLHKTLFANLESIIEPLSPRPPPRDTGSKIDSDVPSSDELDGTNTFTSASSAGNNGQLKDLVGSHELGVSIQQETPQLLMEGDTLDDQDTCCDTLDDRDTNCDTLGDQDTNRDIVDDNYDIPGDQNTNCNIQGNSTASPCEKDIAGILIPAATTVLQERTNVSNRSVDVRGSSLPITISTQSTGCNSTAIDSVVLPNLCLGTLSTSTPVAHVSSPVVVTSSHVNPSAVNMSSLLAHVSSSLVTMSSATANKNYLPSPPVDHVSYALSLLATDPYLINTSLPSLLCNGIVTNEVSSPVLPSSSALTSTSLVSDNCHGSTSSVKVSSCNSASTAETDDQYCDDIIGQSLTLAHNAVRSPPEQLLTSHILCQRSLDGPMPICNPVDDVCTRSCDPHGSCDQQYGSHDQHKSLDSSDVNNTSGTPEVAKPNPTTTTVATSIPSKMSFIDWTEIKRKNVTPSDYPNTPTPVYIESGQDRRDPVMKIKKKKKINTNPTGKKRGWVKGRPRKNQGFQSIMKQIPKPPRTGYMYYLSDYRSEVMKDNPQLPLGEVCNYLAKRWGQLPSEQRELYINKGYVDRQRYISELTAYYHQKNNDFQEQDPDFDPEWATKYLTEYLNSNSDDLLYCPVCNVQFNSLHNKQQHCLGRKHNEEIVMFVQNSVNMHQKKNKSLSSNVNSENHAPNSENHIEDHLDSDTSLMDLTVERTCETEDGVKDNENINVEPISNTDDCMIVIEDRLSNADHHMSCTEHHVSSTKDHMSRTEGSTAGKYCHPSSPEYNNNSPIINCSENTASCSTVISCHESNIKCPTITTCNESTTNYSTVLTCSESTTNCSPIISCSESTTNCTLVQPNTLADCTDILTTISNVDSSEDHVSVTNSCACSSTDLTNNDDNVFVQEHNQPIVHFPPFYSLNHMIHDFKLHQQGMLSSLSENNSLLHSRHAQLQGDCNELEAQVEDMEEQLQYTRKENSDLQSQLEGLSHMINFIAQVNHTQSKDT